MNESRITVRLDDEYRTAELELMTPHSCPDVDGINHALKRMGMRPIHVVEFSTPKYRITRTKLVEMNGSDINATRVAEVLQAAQSRTLNRYPFSCNRAA